MRLEFHPEAALEFEHAVQFYNQRGSNLGRRFAREVRTTIQRIVATPQRWRLLEEDVRRCLVRVFPYSVLYTIEADSILIVAVASSSGEMTGVRAIFTLLPFARDAPPCFRNQIICQAV